MHALRRPISRSRVRAPTTQCPSHYDGSRLAPRTDRAGHRRVMIRVLLAINDGRLFDGPPFGIATETDL